MITTCSICGTRFSHFPSAPRTYCSRQCSGVSRRTTATVDTIGRRIAAEIYPDEKPCEVCGKAGKGRGVIDRHHRNSDRTDNSPGNIAFLCRLHHNAAHRLTDGKVGGGPRPRIVALLRDRALAHYAEAVTLRAEGLTNREIASRLGVDSWSVARWFRKYAA